MLKLTYICFLFSLFILNAQNEQSHYGFKPIGLKKEYVAGQRIYLKFTNPKRLRPQLYISNSYGSTIIESILTKDELEFKLPENFRTKFGIVTFTILINGEKDFQGSYHILPQKKVKLIETYLGPPSIKAGEYDHAMLVTIPVDFYDNPCLQDTEVTFKKSFLGEEEQEVNKVFNLMAFTKIASIKKTGTIFLSCELYGKSSKEEDLRVEPYVPSDFEIFFERTHKHADGNQLLKLYTSKLVDSYGNTVVDGTYVEFNIKNLAGNYLRAFGTTINGVATAQIVHPDYYDKWLVKATVVGMAYSQDLEVIFNRVVKDFPVYFMKDYSEVLVGPIGSFMNQHIPDGLVVNLTVYQDHNLIFEINKPTVKGESRISLDKVNLKDGKEYVFNFKVAEVEKTFKKVFNAK